LGTEVLENHKRYLERINSHKNFCCDIEKENIFVLKKSKPLDGDILGTETSKGHSTIEFTRKGFGIRKHQREILDIVLTHH
jgi:hypothetical protein